MNKNIGIGITEPLMRFYPFKNEIIEGVKAAEEDMANKISGSQYHCKILFKTSCSWTSLHQNFHC